MSFINKYFGKTTFVNLLAIVIIFILDRISKTYVMFLSNNLIEDELFSSAYLNIYLIWNKGIAFGLLSFQHNFFYNIISVLIASIIFVLFNLLYRSSGLKRISYILVVGGALGNLFDRILYKSVPDFIDFHYNNFHWFIFNFADIFITLGIFCLIYVEFINHKEFKNV
jgi:signal peptidase II